ncbi:phosphotransferase [Armatimonas rosea]|uniref:Fructosamine-3-kinase n=1 Tax=Armatimonas rosea TaxID=685828 RepID=A0A7W9SQ06_ARMRO|nr:phosphotransferase [Armatimonas rosea]MBB6050705.1 fructosamine-3-kinase [Armatimonas rosea]
MVRAEAIAREFFGQAATRIEALPGLGSVNDIFVAQFPKKRIVVRLPKPEDRAGAEASYTKELWCLEEATRLGIPSPLVLQFGIHDGWPYQILSYIEGVNGAQSTLAPHLLWHTLGGYARRFHTCSLAGFGESADIFSFVPPPPSNIPPSVAVFCPTPAQRGWQRFVRYNLDSLTANDALLGLGVYASHQRDFIVARFTALQSQPVALGLCHGDLSPRNTVLTPEGTLVLLDWGCAEAHVVPHYDLLNVPDEFLGTFLDGYGWPIETRAALLAQVQDLALLKAFDLVRWAIDRCPRRIEELAMKARARAQSVA